ncbi:methyltransferase domain-containing protein [Pannus brasiliensis CCIBt3594]|uniref:Methyltransferase domain-containing protein n=1 Tax=Pannus brasiliensis CCIBt3594 TaxID=1427578 RepID=A0AAW9QWU7_9CHRO
MNLRKYVKFWKYPRLVREREILIEERDSLKDYVASLKHEKEQLIQERGAIHEKLESLSSQYPELKEVGPRMLDISSMKSRAREFRSKLDDLREQLAPADFEWYRYNTLTAFDILELLLHGKNRFPLDLIDGKPVLDIGCADGDMAFFLESLGCNVRAIDFPPTNLNFMRGIRLLKESLSSSVEIEEMDLDSQFVLPEKKYGLIIFLGILYHLKNPYYVLETLAKSTRYCLISTRVTKFSARENRPDRVDLSPLPVAYLLDPLEANNDSTNYWIFSNTGLQRILRRTGWEICDYITVGNTENSDPASQEGDERAYCLVRSLWSLS